MPIYTKKGDGGQTGLPGKRKLSKTEPLFEVLGALDQASATLGLARSYGQASAEVSKSLETIQRNFLAIGACLAAEQPSQAVILSQLPIEIEKLEATIDQWDRALPELKNFILAGGTTAGATLHLARTIVRAAERNYHRLEERQKFDAVSQYLNRLSDYLFQAARYTNFLAKKPETIWKQNG